MICFFVILNVSEVSYLIHSLDASFLSMTDTFTHKKTPTQI